VSGVDRNLSDSHPLAGAQRVGGPDGLCPGMVDSGTAMSIGGADAGVRRTVGSSREASRRSSTRRGAVVERCTPPRHPGAPSAIRRHSGRGAPGVGPGITALVPVGPGTHG
jgi:hypothetical protein